MAKYPKKANYTEQSLLTLPILRIFGKFYPLQLVRKSLIQMHHINGSNSFKFLTAFALIYQDLRQLLRPKSLSPMSVCLSIVYFWVRTPKKKNRNSSAADDIHLREMI
jgi:hypothetical protein